MLQYGMPPQCKFLFDCTYRSQDPNEPPADVRMFIQSIRGTKLLDALKNCLIKYALFPKADWKNAVFLKDDARLHGQRGIVNDFYCRVILEEKKVLPKKKLCNSNVEDIYVSDAAFFQSSDEEDDCSLIPEFARPGPSEQIDEEYRKIANIYSSQRRFYPEGQYSEHLIWASRRLFQLKNSEPSCPKHILVDHLLANWVDLDPEEERLSDARRVVFRKLSDRVIKENNDANNARRQEISTQRKTNNYHDPNLQSKPLKLIHAAPIKSTTKGVPQAVKQAYLNSPEAKRKEMERRIAARKQREAEKEIANRIKDIVLHKCEIPWTTTKTLIETRKRELEMQGEDVEDIDEEINSILVEKKIRFLLNLLNQSNRNFVTEEIVNLLREHEDEELVDDTFRSIFYEQLVLGYRFRSCFSLLYQALPERNRMSVYEDVLHIFKYGYNPLDRQISSVKESILSTTSEREKKNGNKSIAYLEQKRRMIVYENLRLIADFYNMNMFDVNVIVDTLSSVIDQMENGGLEKVLEHAADLIRRVGQKYISEHPSLIKNFVTYLDKRFTSGHLKQYEVASMERIFSIVEAYDVASDNTLDGLEEFLVSSRERSQQLPGVVAPSPVASAVLDDQALEDDVLNDIDEELEAEILSRSVTTGTSGNESACITDRQPPSPRKEVQNVITLDESSNSLDYIDAPNEASQFSLNTRDIPRPFYDTKENSECSSESNNEFFGKFVNSNETPRQNMDKLFHSDENTSIMLENPCNNEKGLIDISFMSDVTPEFYDDSSCADYDGVSYRTANEIEQLDCTKQDASNPQEEPIHHVENVETIRKIDEEVANKNVNEVSIPRTEDDTAKVSKAAMSPITKSSVAQSTVTKIVPKKTLRPSISFNAVQLSLFGKEFKPKCPPNHIRVKIVRVQKSATSKPLKTIEEHFIPLLEPLTVTEVAIILRMFYKWAGFPQERQPNGEWKTLGPDDCVSQTQLYRFYAVFQ